MILWRKLSCQTNIKRNISYLLNLILLAFIITACSTNHTPTTETGYPCGEIQQAQIMYDNKIYYTQADPRLTLPYGYECVGSVELIDNLNTPDTNFEASRLKIGDIVFFNEAIPDTLYIQIKDKFYRFALQ